MRTLVLKIFDIHEGLESINRVVLLKRLIISDILKAINEGLEVDMTFSKFYDGGAVSNHGNILTSSNFKTSRSAGAVKNLFIHIIG